MQLACQLYFHSCYFFLYYVFIIFSKHVIGDKYLLEVEEKPKKWFIMTRFEKSGRFPTLSDPYQGQPIIQPTILARNHPQAKGNQARWKQTTDLNVLWQKGIHLPQVPLSTARTPSSGNRESYPLH